MLRQRQNKEIPIRQSYVISVPQNNFKRMHEQFEIHIE